MDGAQAKPVVITVLSLAINDDSTEALVLRAQYGDRDAVGKLFERYRCRINKFCYRLSGSVVEAEDLTGEVFLRVVRSIHQFKGNCHFSTWLGRIAINQFQDYLRKKKLRGHFSLDQLVEAEEVHQPIEVGFLDNHLELLPERILATQAFCKLSPRARLYFYLREVKGYSYKQIGEILKCTEQNAKNKCFRAKRSLQKKVGVYNHA